MGFLSRKNKPIAEEPMKIIEPTENQDGDLTREDMRIVRDVLLGTEQVKIYLAAEEGRKIYEVAVKVAKELGERK